MQRFALPLAVLIILVLLGVFRWETTATIQGSTSFVYEKDRWSGHIMVSQYGPPPTNTFSRHPVSAYVNNKLDKEIMNRIMNTVNGLTFIWSVLIVGNGVWLYAVYRR